MKRQMQINRIKITPCWLLVWMVLFFNAQPALGLESKITIHEFLATAFADPTLAPQKNRLKMLQQADPAPFIEDPKLRVQIKPLDSREQKYGLRFGFKGWGETQSEAALYQIGVESGEIALEGLIQDALKARYLTLIDFLYTARMLELHHEMKILYEDWATVLNRYVDTPYFDAEKLSDVENQQIALDLDLMDLNIAYQGLLDRIREQGAYDENIELDDSDLIEIDQLAKHVNHFPVDKAMENIHIRHAAVEAAKDAAQYDLEVSRGKKWLDFIEAAYDVADNDSSEAFSIEFGIPLPFDRGDDENIRKQKLACMRSESAYQLIQTQTTKNLSIVIKHINALLSQYHSVHNKKENSFTSSAFNRLLQHNGTDPLPLLKLKKNMLKTEILTTKLFHRIFQAYIELLDITGRLGKKPFINYLSKEGRERILSD